MVEVVYEVVLAELVMGAVIAFEVTGALLVIALTVVAIGTEFVIM